MNSTDQIVVGVDDSRPSRAALSWAARYARATGSRLVAIHVLELPNVRGLYSYSMLADTVYYDEAQVEEILRTATEKLFADTSPEASWKLLFAQGDAGRILVQESQAAALLVVGAREHQGIGRLLDPSVGHYCLSHASCPVVAVPIDVSAPVVQPETLREPQPVD